MILYNGRVDSELKGKDAAALGRADAIRRHCRSKTRGLCSRGELPLFDQEEGGRLLPEQSAYLFSWVPGITVLSPYKPGVYCSGHSGSGRYKPDQHRAGHPEP